MKKPVYTSHPTRPASDMESDVPQGEPPASAEQVAPNPTADFGGIDSEPQEVLPPNERVEETIDHAGLDQELPG